MAAAAYLKWVGVWDLVHGMLLAELHAKGRLEPCVAIAASLASQR